jgi:hypothetical protein
MGIEPNSSAVKPVDHSYTDWSVSAFIKISTYVFTLLPVRWIHCALKFESESLKLSSSRSYWNCRPWLKWCSADCVSSLRIPLDGTNLAYEHRSASGAYRTKPCKYIIAFKRNSLSFLGELSYFMRYVHEVFVSVHLSVLCLVSETIQRISDW